MSDLEERLNAVMSDPEQMGHIARMASRLMGSIAPEPDAPAPETGGADEALMGMVSRVLGKLRSGGDKRQLLGGMAPYLSPARKGRLEKALRLAAAVRAASAAMEEWGGSGGESV